MASGPRISAPDSGVDPSEAFRKLYYHLYSNSRVSRAERLVSDLSLLLLAKYSSEINGSAADFETFLAGKGTANALLLSHLRALCPELITENDRFSLEDDTLRVALTDLGDVRLSSAPAHLLGDAFQALIGPRLRGERGQFFTPRSIVRAMIGILDPKPEEIVLDPACGTGGFLLETHLQWGPGAQASRLFGLDKDEDLVRFAGAALRISGSIGRVAAINSLDASAWPSHIPQQADVVLTNPPFGAKIGVTDPAILRSFDFGHRWRYIDGHWEREATVLDSQDPQILFLELCVKLLRPDGRLGIVLPEGVFGNKNVGYVWDWLRARGDVLAMIDCPRTTFQPGTDTKTNILFFQRGQPSPPSRPATCLVAVALACGHDRRGRTTLSDGTPYPDDFASIAADYDGHAPGRRWRRTKLARPYYLVPRYYWPAEPVDAAEASLIDGAERLSFRELLDAGALTMRKGVEVGAEAYGTGRVPFVRTSDIANFEIRADATKSVEEAVYLRYAERLDLTPSDVLLTVDGRYRIGETALITTHNCRCIVQSHFRILGTPDKAVVDEYALLFALSLPSVRLGIRNLVFVQSTLGTLGSRLMELRIPILIGEGPWSARVERFRQALQARDSQLAELRATTGGFDLEL
jgi:type I restriction enzyme M protein